MEIHQLPDLRNAAVAAAAAAELFSQTMTQHVEIRFRL